jgi:hypothetical protein
MKNLVVFGWFCVIFRFLQIFETVCNAGYRSFNSGVCNPSRILGNYASKNGEYHFFLSLVSSLLGFFCKAAMRICGNKGK